MGTKHRTEAHEASNPEARLQGLQTLNRRPRLFDAAEVMSQNTISLQLRYLQTVVEIAGEKNSATIFPVPIELLSPFLKDRGEK